MKKKTRAIWLILFIAALSSILFFVNIYQFEKKLVPISKTQPSNVSVFFYRDDCPACNKIFPLVYIKNIFSNDIAFANTNEPSNAKLAQERNVKSVPIIIKNGETISVSEWLSDK